MRDGRFVDVLTFALGVTAVAAVVVWVAPRHVLLAQAPAASPQVAPAAASPNLSIDVFDRMMTELSNWGLWGKDDQKGAFNLITPA
jgi:hypothetical protein